VRLAASSLPRATTEASASARSETARKQDSTRILVNDRLDVALAAEAGGVHLGEKSFPVEEARRFVKLLRRKEDFLIGVSCHSLQAAKAAERGGADYLFVGPVFATPSKAAYGPPQGLKALAEVCRSIAVPVLAIGGKPCRLPFRWSGRYRRHSTLSGRSGHGCGSSGAAEAFCLSCRQSPQSSHQRSCKRRNRRICPA